VVGLKIKFGKKLEKYVSRGSGVTIGLEDGRHEESIGLLEERE
jgi:hypothetical protein